MTVAKGIAHRHVGRDYLFLKRSHGRGHRFNPSTAHQLKNSMKPATRRRQTTVRLKSLPVIAPCVLALAGNLAGASSHSSSHASLRASPFAPRTHSTSHVYGSPIGHPLVSRSSSHRSTGHSSSHHPRTSHASSQRAVGVTRAGRGRIERRGAVADQGNGESEGQGRITRDSQDKLVRCWL